MRTTYLLQEKQLDGSTCLVETTAENWHAIVRACAKLPTISAATLSVMLFRMTKVWTACLLNHLIDF